MKNTLEITENNFTLLQKKPEEESPKITPILRVLPHNIEAEQALLGAMLVNNEVIHRVGDYLYAEHFYMPVHQRIFQTITHYIDRGILADCVTLKNLFDKDEALQKEGGGVYLIRLVEFASTVLDISHYGKLIYDLHIRRSLVGVGEEIVNEAYEDSEKSTAQKQLEQAEFKLFHLAMEGHSETGFQAIKYPLIETLTRIENARKRNQAVTGISTGFRDMDTLLGGFHNSDLLILAGRPSMGKTAFAINLAVNAAKFLSLQASEAVKKASIEKKEAPLSVGFFSLEMSSEQLATRMLSMVSNISASTMRLGTIQSENDHQMIVQASREIEKLPFFIDDTPALSIAALRTRARRLKRRHNVGLILVDYLQLVKGSERSKEMNRVQEVSEVTQGLKAIAKELNVPVIALSQLSRAVEQREDKRPQLSDLRESGSIEQDSDIVMFIYREEYYLQREKPQETANNYTDWLIRANEAQSKTDIFIAKHRNGPIGHVPLYFNAETTSFCNFSKDEAPNISAIYRP